jgi:S1-C subfamily serine protease
MRTQHRARTRIALRIATPVVATAWCAATLAAQAPEVLSTATIAARSIPATATVFVVNARGDTVGQGSGFFIESGDLLVTNYHVVRRATTVYVVRAGSERREPSTPVLSDRSADIALLRVDRSGARSASQGLTLRETVPAVGERVVVIGSPLGLSSTVSEGIISAFRDRNGRDMIQISAAVSPGSSGGPVLDESGRVIAVATGYLEGGQQINFAVPASYVTNLVDRLERQPDPPQVASRPPRSSPPARSTQPPRANGRQLRSRQADGEQLPEGAWLTQYQGTATNSALLRAPGTVTVSFSEVGSSLAGRIDVSEPLGGSGPFTGSWHGESIVMVSTSHTGDTITWTGSPARGRMRGVYSVDGGPYRGQRGVWEVSRSRGGALEYMLLQSWEPLRQYSATLLDTLRAIPGATQLIPLSEDGAFFAAFEIAARGLARLSDGDLVWRSRAVNEMLQGLDQRTCAAVSRERPSPLQLYVMLSQLSPENQERWMQISLAAISAELRGSAAPQRPSSSQTNQAWAAVLASMSEKTVRRLAFADGELGSMSDADVCGLARGIYSAVARVPEPHRSVIARQLALD